MPDQLESGVLYISIEYGTAVHSCCCGCGEEVVTPITPTDWTLIYDGETISLSPSIGNWKIPCRSHYFIEQSRVIDAKIWNDKQVGSKTKKGKEKRGKYFSAESQNKEQRQIRPMSELDDVPKGLWEQIKRKVGRRR